MKAIFSPSIPWLNTLNNHQNGIGPDPSHLFKLLESQGIEVKIIDPTRGFKNPFDGKDTLLQSIDPWRALSTAFGERDANVVVSVFEGAAISLSAIRWTMQPRTSLVMWDIGLTDWRLRNKLINFALPKIDELMVLGVNQVDYIKKTYTTCPSISVIGHYIDADFYQQVSLSASGHILSVGDDVGRDFPTLNEATRGLGRKVVIKASRHPPGDTHGEVQVIKNRISFLELRDLYAQAAVVVVPTFVTPNACGVSSILEASAMGRPLVVSDNPGIRDFVIPNETCLVVPPGDASALREAIHFLLDNPVVSKRLGDGARHFVEKNCTCDVFADRFGNALRRVVETKERSSRH